MIRVFAACKSPFIFHPTVSVLPSTYPTLQATDMAQVSLLGQGNTVRPPKLWGRQ